MRAQRAKIGAALQPKGTIVPLLLPVWYVDNVLVSVVGGSVHAAAEIFRGR